MKLKMETKHEREKAMQRGNAMIYVLIAIVLFAALSLTLGRQTSTGEANDLGDAKSDLYATQLIAYATSAKSASDQMTLAGMKVDNLDFTQPGQSGFNNTPTVTKIFHPDGGGLNPGTLPQEVIDKTLSTPSAGWYIGRFNNVDWTKTNGQDVILTAYGIKKSVCQASNMRARGTKDIPKMTDTIRAVLLSSAVGGGSNVDFTTDPTSSPICADCAHRSSLCVEDKNGGVYGYYTVIADQ